MKYKKNKIKFKFTLFSSRKRKSLNENEIKKKNTPLMPRLTVTTHSQTSNVALVVPLESVDLIFSTTTTNMLSLNLLTYI